MAPANQHGYALLPTEDLALAGGPLTVSGAEDGLRSHSTTLSKLSRSNSGDSVEPLDPRGRHIKYEDGLRFDLSAGAWVIHPYRPAVVGWNCFLVLLLLVDIIYLPLETAFGLFMSKTFMFWFNGISTAVFAADIVLQFFLQTPSPQGNFWIFNHRKIVVAYLTGAFILDLISVMPFCEIYAMAARSAHHSKLYMLHMLRFTKLLRLVRLKRIFMRYNYDVNITYQSWAILQSGAAIIVSLHIMSCLWSTLGNYQVGENWITELNRDKSWDGDRRSEDPPGAGEQSALLTYITSAYFAIYTLTSIGYGDIHPTTLPELVCCIGMMLVGSLIWTSVIGEFVGVFRHADMQTLQHHEARDMLLHLSREHNLSRDLRLRLQIYMQQSVDLMRMNFVQEKIISRMSSELAIHVTTMLHGSWIANVWWLKDVQRTPFMVQLSLRFKPIVYCPNEEIKSCDRLHVITRGLCVHGQSVLGKDKCWGVDMLLTQVHLRINVLTVAITYLQVLYLTREALQEVTEQFPREREIVRRAYRILCLMRGVVNKAREMQMEEKRRRDSVANTPSVDRVKRRGIFSYIGTQPSSPDSTFTTVGPSTALMRNSSADETIASINEATSRLDQMEKDFNKRLAAVEQQVAEALEIVSGVVRARSR